MVNHKPHLRRANRPVTSGQRPQAIVFVHGIYSEAETCFRAMVNCLTELPQAEGWDLWLYDYDFHQSIAKNGEELGEEITKHLSDYSQVHLVGHSMGGLVARLAVLKTDLPKVHRIVTLATPNSGTLAGAQLSLLGHMALGGIRTVWAYFPRKQGIEELTRAHKVMQSEAEGADVHLPQRLQKKSYISIPARFYHRRRSPMEKSASVTMSGVSWAFSIINYAVRHRMVKFEPAHDGIVEERDVCLNPCSQGSWPETERLGSIKERDARVLHVAHRSADRLDHVTIAHDPWIAKLVLAVLSAPSLTKDDVEQKMGVPSGLDFGQP
jgi:pimeloyl-ACP methyl ester carboxylesterase